MVGREHRSSGVYLAGTRTVELDIVSAWAEELRLPVVQLSQENAVEREVDPEATLVAVDATENPLDAIAQTARIRATHSQVPLLLLGPGEEAPSSFLRAATRCGADIILERPLARLTIFNAIQQLVPNQPLRAYLGRNEVWLGNSCLLDMDGRCLRVAGTERRLTKAKFELLAYLIRRAGQAVSAEQLVRAGVLLRSQRSRYRAIVLELRSKLGNAKNVIRTVPGYGYRFDTPQESCGQSLETRGPSGAPRVRVTTERRSQ